MPSTCWRVSCVSSPWPPPTPIRPPPPALAVDPVPELALPPLFRSSRLFGPSIVTLAPLMLTLTTLPPPLVEPVPSRHSEHALVVASAEDIDSRPVSLSISTRTAWHIRHEAGAVLGLFHGIVMLGAGVDTASNAAAAASATAATVVGGIGVL
uniref:Uncharacterized protein n=1 Tax=Anopheles farauti TaxID=69004 RepID=A0A182QF02_9DIPT